MLPETTPQNETAIACDPNALTPDQQERWVNEIVPKLYSQVQEIQELPNGWSWRLPSTPEILSLIAEDLNMERLCCPFVHYTLEIEPNHAPFLLRMTGGAGVKEFLRMAFEAANYFDEQVAKTAGLDISAKPKMDSVEIVLEATQRLNDEFAKTAGSS